MSHLKKITCINDVKRKVILIIHISFIMRRLLAVVKIRLKFMCIHIGITLIQNFAMHVLKNFDSEKAVDDDDDETNGDDLLTDGSRRGTNGPG